MENKMFISLNEILGYTLRGTDDEIGKTKDFLFDDREWIIRYLTVDTGNWLIDRLVIISPTSIVKTSWANKELEADLTKAKVENSPRLETNKPVSKQHENELIKYYGWPTYYGALGYGINPADIPRPMLESSLNKLNVMKKNSEDPHLRSVDEVLGYNIITKDGEIGHVEDFVADSGNWEIMYMIIDTRNFFPGGKKVLCAIDWIENINFIESNVEIMLSKEEVKNGPQFNPSDPVNRKYEERLYDYYGRPKYWL
jgi:hypothetical protein